MTKDVLFSQNAVSLPLHFLKIAQYAANQCTGCSDPPMILAYKAQQAMLEAFDKGEDPFEKLNSFLGTSIPEEVLLSLMDE